MENYLSTELPFLIFAVKNRLFGLSTQFVQEMLAVPAITHIPDAPEWVRGVINIRGKVYKLIDMRMRMGIASREQEITELTNSLSEREKEHKHWIDELEACVKEEREFTLGVDPHACKFGTWYDNYKTDDTVVGMELKKFDRPHKAIHATAEQVLELAAEGKKEDALSIIEARRNGELTTMINLFSSIKEILHETNREIAVIVELEQDSFALAVDSVEAVEQVAVEDEGSQSGNMLKEFGAEFNGRIVHRNQSEELLILVDPYWIGGTVLSAAPAK